LDSTQVGKTYNVFLNGTFITSYSGTGSNIVNTFPAPTGTYTVVGIDSTSGCTTNMTGSVTVVIDSLLPVTNGQLVGGDLDADYDSTFFQFTLGQCADSYEFIVATDVNFTNVVVDQNIPASSLTLPIELTVC